MKFNPLVIGCMRFDKFDTNSMNEVIHFCIDNGYNHFDHADIYGAGRSEEVFGDAIFSDNSIKRENIVIQSKCGIVNNVKYPYYNLSKDHIIKSVENSLKRLKTDYLDILLLHRPDALVRPEEVAKAFESLKSSGKVLEFGVSNHKPSQIELLEKYCGQKLIINQLQFSLPVSNMIANGMEVNMTTSGAFDYDGSVLDYCRLKDMIIQAWSPLQMPDWQGCFIDNPKYKQLNSVLSELAEKYGTSKSSVAYAWILRHPAKMQVVTGSTSKSHLQEAFDSVNIELTREQWYRLYLASGHILP